MSRRTEKQIEKDFGLIRKAAETAKSLDEIARLANISIRQVQISLAKHPNISSQIMAQLAENRGEFIAKVDLDEIANERTVKDGRVFYVIDTSVASEEYAWLNLIETANQNGDKIVLTTLTIRELDYLQKSAKQDAYGARKLLAKAAENEKDVFVTVTIPERKKLPDDNLIDYCFKSKSNIVLVTSDKVMAIKAREHLKVKYIKKETRENEVQQLSNTANNSFFSEEDDKKELTQSEKEYILSKKTTTIPANLEGDKLVISVFNTRDYSIRLFTNGVAHDEGPIEVAIGDEVFIATKINKMIRFDYCKIIKLQPQNNAEVIHREFTSIMKYDVMKNPTYRKFVREFVKKIFSAN